MRTIATPARTETLESIVLRESHRDMERQRLPFPVPRRGCRQRHLIDRSRPSWTQNQCLLQPLKSPESSARRKRRPNVARMTYLLLKHVAIRQWPAPLFAKKTVRRLRKQLEAPHAEDRSCSGTGIRRLHD